MRTYYIFKVNEHIANLTRTEPYYLYNSLSSIYKNGKSRVISASNIYEQISEQLNKELINKSMIKAYCDNDFYMFSGNHHNFYNKYKDEGFTLETKNTYLVCKSNYLDSVCLKNLKGQNFFACDFENNDYFWLDEIYC